MPNSGTVIAIVAIFAILFLFTRNTGIESFASAVPVEMTLADYAQDVRVVASYVGPYIGEIYTYLRTMYSDASRNSALPIFYQPTSDTEETLKDPLVPIARTQVKAWIDSAKVQMNKRYGASFIDAAKALNDLRYEEKSNGVLHVVLVQDGVTGTFLL